MKFPTVEYNIKNWSLPNETQDLSVDFEFNGRTPTLVGLSAAGSAGSFEPSAAVSAALRDAYNRGVRFVGHNSITADRPLLDDILGERTPLDRHEDTMILHYLCNADFVSMPKAKGPDDEEARGMGLLDLWSMSSLYTDLSGWKNCRDGLRWNDEWTPPIHCDGPCPVHDKKWYNGIDAWAVDDALPRLRADLKRKKIPQDLIDRTKEHTVYCATMQETGVKIDMRLVQELEKTFEENKLALFPKKFVQRLCGTCGRMAPGKGPCKRCRDGGRELVEVPAESSDPVENRSVGILRYDEVFDSPFNPNASAQIQKFFGIGSATKEDIETLVESLEEGSERRLWAERLFDYKDEGKGLKGWFGEKYVDSNNLAHARFIPTGTATGRTSSADPNFQNIPKVGFGKRVRAAIIPRDNSLVLVRADYKNLEFRTCLWYAFVHTLNREFPKLEYDAFQWLLERVGTLFDDLSRRMGRSPRDVAKSVSHAADYMEGIKIFRGRELDSVRTKELIRKGALVVHRDWEVGGGVVGFTGVNLAKRLFGSATDEHRRAALEIQEIYFNQVPELRVWHRTVGEDVDRGYVRSATGRYLTLRGSTEDRYKAATAFLGQGAGADVKIESVIASGRSGIYPIIDLHDELVYERDRTLSVSNHRDFMSTMMVRESKLLPGFTCPIDIEIGYNWGKRSEENPRGLISLDKWDPNVVH